MTLIYVELLKNISSNIISCNVLHNTMPVDVISAQELLVHILERNAPQTIE